MLFAGDTVFDIGGHIGTITVPLAKKVGASGHVYTFEVQRRLYEEIITNVHLNRLWNVVLGLLFLC